MTTADPEVSSDGSQPLQRVDPEMFRLIRKEERRQIEGIELIASENFTSRAVMECLGSCLTNKYSEGQPGARYYGGNAVIDEIEILCQTRALQAFHLDPNVWSVNVQPYSGSPANFAVYTALLNPHDRIMGLDLASGGHLTHGFYTAKKKVSATSIYFESFPYSVDQKTGWLDFDSLLERAKVFRPKMIIAGISCYPRDMNFKKFRSIADEVGALLFCDIAHVSGLVAAGLHSNPFEYADVVSTTTHKSLRGPRAGMIFVNTQRIPNGKEKIDSAVFPSLQGGPHNHQIGALAVQLKEVASPGWKAYAERVVENSKSLAESLKQKGFKIVTDGTDNHMVVIDLRPMNITGSKFEKVSEMGGISLNKNAIHGDTSAMNPSGVRVGLCAMTTRGCLPQDMEKIAACLHKVVGICQEIQETYGRKLVDFTRGVTSENPQILELQSLVKAFAEQFQMPGVLHE